MIIKSYHMFALLWSILMPYTDTDVAEMIIIVKMVWCAVSKLVFQLFLNQIKLAFILNLGMNSYIFGDVSVPAIAGIPSFFHLFRKFSAIKFKRSLHAETRLGTWRDQNQTKCSKSG